MKFLTFIETDLRKIIPFLIGLYALAIAGFQGIFVKLVNNLNESLVQTTMQNGTTMEELVKSMEPISLTAIIDQNPYPLLLLIFIGLVFILFGFFLWYKEWFGASKRIYLLLSIKGNRFRIFLSKLIVFLFIFLAYYGVILINLLISSQLMKFMLPDQATAENLVQNFLINSQFVGYVMPTSLSTLLYQIAFIVMIFSILSVFVLLDRSKRILGMITGFIYVAASIVLFIYLNTQELYTSEKLMANWAFSAAYILVSMAISYYLLKRKVSI